MLPTSLYYSIMLSFVVAQYYGYHGAALNALIKAEKHYVPLLSF